MKRVLAAAMLMITILLTACAAPAYTCTDPLGCLEIPSGSPVFIGLLYTSEGPDVPLGLVALKQVEQAIEERDLLLNHEIDLIREGTDCTPEGAREAATRLARTSDLVAVIGPTCTSDADIATSILSDAGIAILTPYLPDAHTATDLLFTAVEQTAVRGRGGTIYIPRTILRDALIKIGETR
jgi:branched-chain amino acid transport system substrate-binding protein